MIRTENEELQKSNRKGNLGQIFAKFNVRFLVAKYCKP